MTIVTITVASDIDHENLVAEIYLDGTYFALVTHDSASGELVVIFPENSRKFAKGLPLELVQNALEDAKRRLVGS